MSSANDRKQLLYCVKFVYKKIENHYPNNTREYNTNNLKLN